jgi:GDP-D-mannose 3',5'-epimerase
MMEQMSHTQQRVLVAGGGGFIGGHLAAYLLRQGHAVVVVDTKPLRSWYQLHESAENVSASLEEKATCLKAVEGCDTVYNLACNMGGMGFITNNKALCMLSVLINTHLLMAGRECGIKEYFYSSSACVYPDYRQEDAHLTALRECDAYPAMPENGYGWEKLFSERLCKHYEEDFGMKVRVARFHNVYGPHGTWDGGREKAPAAICRKVIEAQATGVDEIEIWGDGEQTRSFMYIDDCITGIEKLMRSTYSDPMNLGRSELVSINELADIVQEISGIRVRLRHNLNAPQGVRGRNSDNTLIKQVLGWEPEINLRTGLEKTYCWIKEQYNRRQCGEYINE